MIGNKLLRHYNVINKVNSRHIMLRKLDKYEKMILKADDRNSLTRIRLKSNIDIFEKENLKAFKKSIQLWKNTHQLLSSRILKLNDDEYYYDCVEDKPYDNVKFLGLNAKQSLPRVYNSIADMLVETSISQEIDPDKNPDQLLWHINLIELENEQRVYEIQLQIHHTISQARTDIILIRQLLRIFEKIVKGEPIELKQYELFKGLEAILKEQQENLVAEEGAKVKMPSFIDPKRARKNQMNQKPLQHLDSSLLLLDVETRTTFDSVKNLMKNSREYHMKNRTVYLDNLSLKRLLERCNEQKVKLAGCIEVVTCLALMQLYNKYGCMNELEEIVNYILVSMRSRMNKTVVSDETIGYCVKDLMLKNPTKQMQKLLGDNLDNSQRDSFWKLAREESAYIHESIKSNRLEIVAPHLNEDELFCHFWISNCGDYGYEHFGLFEIESISSCSSYDINQINQILKNYLMVYGNKNGEKCFKSIFMYNSFFIDTSLVEEFIQFYESFLNQILKA